MDFGIKIPGRANIRDFESAAMTRFVIPLFQYIDGQLPESGEQGETKNTHMSKDPKSVFVVHGRDEALRNSMFDFLRAIGLQPLEWSQAIEATGEASPYIGQVLDAAFSIAQAVVILMTPDDEALLKKRFHTEHDPPYEKQLTGQARPNVLFEAGMAMGRDAKRTVLVEVGKLRPFSDVAGRHALRFDGSPAKRHELANRLVTAGCAVQTNGTDWLSKGNFDLPQETVSPKVEAIQDQDLPQEAIQMLVRFANSIKNIPLQQAAIGMNLTPGKVEYYADLLIDRKLIVFAGGRVGAPFNYAITPQGRKYLFDRKLL